MQTNDNDSSDDLDDTQLLAKESMQRHEFTRLEQEEEPRLRETTYGVSRGSRRLVESWERWWDTNLAARSRGLLTRQLGR